MIYVFYQQQFYDQASNSLSVDDYVSYGVCVLFVSLVVFPSILKLIQ
mgnify:CR=1